MNKQKEGLLKNITSVGFVQIANYVFPMITIPIVARIIGPDKLGVINFNASFVAYFTLLIGFGFDLTATRKIAADPENEEKRNQVFSEVLTSQSLLFLASVVIFTVALYSIPELEGEKLVAVFTFLTCLATLFTQNWLFQAMQDLPKVAVLNVVSKVVFTVSVLALVHTKDDYIWQPLALSLSQVIMAGLSLAWAVRKYKLKYKFVNMLDCANLLWHEKQVFLSLCLISLYSTTNIFILGLLQSSEQVGYYSAGEKIIMILKSLILVPFTQALFPYIGKAFADNFKEGIAFVQKLVPIITFVGTTAMLFIYVFSPFIITMLYGHKFAPAIEVCRILSLIPLLVGINSLLGIHVMMNLKMDKYFLSTTLIGSIVGISLSIYLTQKMGYLGPALTWLSVEILNAIILFYILWKKSIKVVEIKYFNILNLRVSNLKKMIQT